MRKLAGIILAISLGFGAAVTLPAAPAIARDTDWPCPGC